MPQGADAREARRESQADPFTGHDCQPEAALLGARERAHRRARTRDARERKRIADNRIGRVRARKTATVRSQDGGRRHSHTWLQGRSPCLCNGLQCDQGGRFLPQIQTPNSTDPVSVFFLHPGTSVAVHPAHTRGAKIEHFKLFFLMPFYIACRCARKGRFRISDYSEKEPNCPDNAKIYGVVCCVRLTPTRKTPRPTAP